MRKAQACPKYAMHISSYLIARPNRFVNWDSGRNVIIIIMVRRSREIIWAQHGSMDISAKYSIAHSHAWATRRIYAVLI